jgi:hypothetical protein
MPTDGAPGEAGGGQVQPQQRALHGEDQQQPVHHGDGGERAARQQADPQVVGGLGVSATDCAVTTVR